MKQVNTLLILAGIYTPGYKFLIYSAIFGHGDNPADSIKTSTIHFLDQPCHGYFQLLGIHEIIRQRQTMEDRFLRRWLRDLPGAGYSFICEDDEASESGELKSLSHSSFAGKNRQSMRRYKLIKRFNF